MKNLLFYLIMIVIALSVITGVFHLTEWIFDESVAGIVATGFSVVFILSLYTPVWCFIYKLFKK